MSQTRYFQSCLITSGVQISLAKTINDIQRKSIFHTYVITKPEAVLDWKWAI